MEIITLMISSTSFLTILRAIKNCILMLLQNLLKQERFLLLSMESNQLFSSYPHAFKSVVSDTWALNSFPTQIRCAEVLGVTTPAGLPGFPTRLPQPAVPTSRLPVLHHRAENLASPERAGCRQGCRGCSAQSSAKKPGNARSRLAFAEAGTWSAGWSRGSAPGSAARGWAPWGGRQAQAAEAIRSCSSSAESSSARGPPSQRAKATQRSRPQRSDGRRGSAALKREARAWIIWEENMTSQKFCILNACKKKGFLQENCEKKFQDRTTQAALFRRGRCFKKQADVFCTGFLF